MEIRFSCSRRITPLPTLRSALSDSSNDLRDAAGVEHRMRCNHWARTHNDIPFAAWAFSCTSRARMGFSWSFWNISCHYQRSFRFWTVPICQKMFGNLPQWSWKGFIRFMCAQPCCGHFELHLNIRKFSWYSFGCDSVVLVPKSCIFLQFSIK